MADTDNEATRQTLQNAQRTPIADLELDLANQNERVIEGEITITWPFSIVTRSIAFKLVEKDYRLRMNNGQVRVDFHGAAGKAVAKAAIGGGDDVHLSLEGVKWTEAPLPKRPDTVKWQLEFTDRLRMTIQRAEDGEEVTLDVDGPIGEETDTPLPLPIEIPDVPAQTTQTPTPAPAPISVEPTPSPLLATPSLPTKRLASTAFEEEEYASPAFLKRSRLSHGGFWEGDLEDFDDTNKRKKKKRRSRFSMVQKWTYSSRTPSPEPGPQPELEAEDSDDEDEQVEELPAKVSPPMVDEGVQTRIEDKVPLPAAQTIPSSLAPSASPSSSPTPARSSKMPVEPVEDEHGPDLNAAEERRQAAPQPNLFETMQPFGQSQTATTSHNWGYGSNNTSSFGKSSELASQTSFGAVSAAPFGSSSHFGAPTSSANVFGRPSGEGFGVGAKARFGSSSGTLFGSNTGNAAGSTFQANSGNGFGSGFGAPKSNARESPAPQFAEQVVDPQIVPQEENILGDEEHKLYQASDFFSAPADHGAPEPALLEATVGDFTHDIANDVPAFAPSQLEQASWGTLTSMPPPSQAPESNTFDNPVEILSSSPKRGPSPDLEHDVGELEDQQPEISDIEQEEEQSRQEGYMQVEPVPDDTPVDTGESAMQSQGGETDEYEDGGDLAGEDYDLRNYDDAQEDDVVESDDESERVVDPEDPDQQAVNFDEDESESEEEEELEYSPPGGMGHGVSGENGEFDADGEVDDGYGYGEDYDDEDEEGDPMDYDEEELSEESPVGRASPLPSSKEPVFIDLLSDSEDDEAPSPAPAAPSQAVPLPTAAPQERQSEDEDDLLEVEVPTGSAELAQHASDAELDDRLKDVEAMGQSAQGPAAAELEDEDSNIDSPPSRRSSPPPSEDEDLGPTSAPFSLPIAASSQKQQQGYGEDEDETEVELQDPDHIEISQTVQETQQASGDKNTQSSVAFESQPRNDFSFAASATQQDNSQDDPFRLTEPDVVEGASVDKGAIDTESTAQRKSPEAAKLETEIHEVIEEIREEPGTEVDEFHTEAVVEKVAPVETDRAVASSEPVTHPDEIITDAGEPADERSEQAIEQPASVPETQTQTLRLQEAEQISATPVPETLTQTLRAQEIQLMQPAEQDAAALVGEASPPPSQTQRAEQEMQVGEEVNDTDSEAEYSFALEQQIMDESQSARDSQAPQAEVPSIEQPDSHEKTSRRVTRSRAKDKPDRDILITVESLRSWDAKSMSSRATSAEESQKTQHKTDGRSTPEPRQPSQSQASPQSIRVTRSKNYDNDPSMLLVAEPSKRKGHKEPSVTDRETRSSVAASAEPEERPQSQASMQSIRVTRSHARDDDPSMMLAGYKDSQQSQLSSQDASQELREATPRPRKIRGEVTPEPELGSERSLRSRTPEPAAADKTSPSADKEKAVEETSFVEEDETITSLKSKLSKELRSNLAGYVPLSVLKSHIGERKDIMAVVTATPEPAVKLKAGPRDHLLEVLVTDPASANSSTSVSVAHLLRPRKDALPTVTVGDVILLRHFSIASMTGRGYGVRSGEGSAWAVWEKSDGEGHPQIRGPPVELGDAERRYADGLRRWWELVEEDEKIRGKVERKTAMAVKVGKENKGKGK